MTSEALNQASRPRASTFTDCPMCTLLTHDRIQSNCSQQPHSSCGSASLDTLQTPALQPLAHLLRLSKKSFYGTFLCFCCHSKQMHLKFPNSLRKSRFIYGKQSLLSGEKRTRLHPYIVLCIWMMFKVEENQLSLLIWSQNSCEHVVFGRAW